MPAITDLIGGATDSSYSAPTQQNTFVPGNLDQGANNYYTAANGAVTTAAGNPYLQNQPMSAYVLDRSFSNPYQTTAQTAADAAGSTYGTAGTIANAGQGTLSDSAMQLLSAGQQTWNSANDPQSALYNRTLQQLQDQTRAGQAARGITMSPVGANLENQALSNFNIDWQNNQLARQTQGLSALQGANNTANTDLQGASTLGTTAAQDVLNSGQTGYGQFYGNLGNQTNALGNYNTTLGSSGQGLQNASLAQLLSYLNLGANQSNNQANLNNQFWQNQNTYTSEENQQNERMWGDIGSIAGDGLAAGYQGFFGGAGGGSGLTAQDMMNVQGGAYGAGF